MEGIGTPFCPRCGKEASTDSIFCNRCGLRLPAVSELTIVEPPREWVPTPQPSTHLPLKNPGVAAVLALVVGALLFWGVGHIYVGKVMRGIGIMILGWIFEGLFLLSFLGPLLGLAMIGFGLGGFAMGILGLVLFGVISLVGWIWQTFDAYSLAKQYNEYVRTHGVEPW